MSGGNLSYYHNNNTFLELFIYELSRFRLTQRNDDRKDVHEGEEGEIEDEGVDEVGQEQGEDDGGKGGQGDGEGACEDPHYNQPNITQYSYLVPHQTNNVEIESTNKKRKINIKYLTMI